MCSNLLRWILHDYCRCKKKREIAGTGWRHKGYFCLCASSSVSLLDCLLGSGCYIQVGWSISSFCRTICPCFLAEAGKLTAEKCTYCVGQCYLRWIFFLILSHFKHYFLKHLLSDVNNILIYYALPNYLYCCKVCWEQRYGIMLMVTDLFNKVLSAVGLFMHRTVRVIFIIRCCP